MKTEASNAGEVGWKGPRALSAHRAAAPSPRPKSFHPWRGFAFFWKKLENREMELIPFRDWIERSFGRTPKLASSHKLLCHLFSRICWQLKTPLHKESRGENFWSAASAGLGNQPGRCRTSPCRRTVCGEKAFGSLCEFCQGLSPGSFSFDGLSVPDLYEEPFKRF